VKLTVADIVRTYGISKQAVLSRVSKGILIPKESGVRPMRFDEEEVREVFRPRHPEERFWNKVNKTETCWEWTAARHTNGYGAFWSAGRMRPAHRHSYELVEGPIPEGLELDHICHNRGCVNPDHLRPVTTKQNQENCWRVNTPSGVRGVYRDKNRWRAQVTHQGKSYYNGNYERLEDAEAAAIALRNRLFTHNDHDRSSEAMPEDLRAYILVPTTTRHLQLPKERP